MKCAFWSEGNKKHGCQGICHLTFGDEYCALRDDTDLSFCQCGGDGTNCIYLKEWNKMNGKVETKEETDKRMNEALFGRNVSISEVSKNSGNIRRIPGCRCC